MGDVALWIPSDGSQPGGFTAKILFSSPTRPDKISDVEYTPFDAQMEYHTNDFTNLKSSVDSGRSENITIGGNTYFVKSVEVNWDGGVNIAKLEKNVL